MSTYVSSVRALMLSEIDPLSWLAANPSSLPHKVSHLLDFLSWFVKWSPKVKNTTSKGTDTTTTSRITITAMTYTSCVMALMASGMVPDSVFQLS